MGAMDIRVDRAGLTGLANQCQHLGTTIAAEPPVTGGPSGQPTAAAVRATHASVTATAARLAARMADTAATAVAAAAAYVSTDDTSAGEISAVPDGLTEA